jgi:hypothetical protein
MQSGSLTYIPVMLDWSIRTEADMKHWLCTISAAAILASGSVFAADLGRGAPPAPLPPPAPLFT